MNLQDTVPPKTPPSLSATCVSEASSFQLRSGFFLNTHTNASSSIFYDMKTHLSLWLRVVISSSPCLDCQLLRLQTSSYILCTVPDLGDSGHVINSQQVGETTFHFITVVWKLAVAWKKSQLTSRKCLDSVRVWFNCLYIFNNVWNKILRWDY